MCTAHVELSCTYKTDIFSRWCESHMILKDKLFSYLLFVYVCVCVPGCGLRRQSS
jgi:hypothetical protein